MRALIAGGVTYLLMLYLLRDEALDALFKELRGDLQPRFGVTEARANQKMLGQEGVREVVQSHADAPADRIAEAIFQRAREFAQGVLRDDVAIVVVKNG